MDMQGQRILAVTQQQAWDALNDPEVLKVCIPGCDKVEASGDNQYVLGVSVKIGPVSAKFSGRITLSDINPPHSYTLSFDGQGGAAGFGKGSSQVRLTSQDIGCELSYTVKAQVGGKIAQMGQRLIDGVAKGMAEDFFKRFDDEMRRRHPQAAASDTAGPQALARAAGEQASSNDWTARGGLPGWIWLAAGAITAAFLFAVSR